MNPQTIVIPTNYTDSGKLFGMFEKRNAIETVCLALPVIFFIVMLSPFSIHVNLILGAVILVPLCGFSLFGIRDYSLISYLLIYCKWRKNRRTVTYKGGKDQCQKSIK